jgi:hypothetical protein
MIPECNKLENSQRSLERNQSKKQQKLSMSPPATLMRKWACSPWLS